jgi:hypothetical protein
MCPLTQGYRKEPPFHSKRRSGWDRESNPGHLRGKQRCKTLCHPLRLCIRVCLRLCLHHHHRHRHCLLPLQKNNRNPVAVAVLQVHPLYLSLSFLAAGKLYAAIAKRSLFGWYMDTSCTFLSGKCYQTNSVTAAVGSSKLKAAWSSVI